MNKAYISFSFDDGRIDNYTIAYPILKKYHLPATFNITTGYVEGKFKKGSLTNAEPMSLDMVRELYNDSTMEIAGHGYWHRNTVEDITRGVQELKQQMDIHTGKEIDGFASPGTGLDMDYYHKYREELHASGIQYVRLSLRYLSNPKVKTFVRKVSRVFPFPFLYRWAYQDTLMESIQDDILYSIPVLSSVSVEQLKSLIGHAVRKKKACILMLHSIVETGQCRDNWDFDKEKFDRLCMYLSNAQDKGLLEVVTSQKVYELMKAVE